jgi:hypothetical protein
VAPAASEALGARRGQGHRAAVGGSKRNDGTLSAVAGQNELRRSPAWSDQGRLVVTHILIRLGPADSPYTTSLVRQPEGKEYLVTAPDSCLRSRRS